MNEKKREARVMRFERRLPHSPEKVWRALTEKAELAAWFPAVIEGERRAGAPLQFHDPKGEKEATPGVIRRYEPPRTLVYTWGSETLRFELEPVTGGCLLVLTTSANDDAITNSSGCRMAA